MAWREPIRPQKKGTLAREPRFALQICLFLPGRWSFFVVLFFWNSDILASGISFERAVATGRLATAKLIDPTKGESASLKSIELHGDSYRLVFQISPGQGTATILTDALGRNVKHAIRQ